MSVSIMVGDSRELLAKVEGGSARCCVTSPPYWGLRDYGVEGQLGLERTPEEYVSKLVAVFREVRRVLTDDGTLWLNLGSSYMGGGPHHGDNNLGKSGTNRRLKQKDMVPIPWMVAMALQADGWYLRSDIIWAKPNPMPESVTDRPTKAHEYLFLLSKSARYFYDAAAIAEDSTFEPGTRRRAFTSPRAQAMGREPSGNEVDGWVTESGTRNKRSVWTIATQPFPEAHFATFPTALVEPCILAGSQPGDTILDPFAGAGTTGLVASRLNRNFVGIELNTDYAEMARQRIQQDAPLLNAVTIGKVLT